METVDLRTRDSFISLPFRKSEFRMSHPKSEVNRAGPPKQKAQPLRRENWATGLALGDDWL
jgi:hypothetical protein